MSDPARWLPVAAIIAFLAAFLYLVRRIVERQAAKISAQLDACDYVVIEAAPEQLPAMKTDYEANGWRLAESKPYRGRGVLYTFRRIDGLSATLSELLGFGAKKPRGFVRDSDSDFQMKIKAHGSIRDLDALAAVPEESR